MDDENNLLKESSYPKEPFDRRLKRFLHFGSEIPLYLPGDRFFQACFKPDKLTAITDLIAEQPEETHGEAVSLILKACMDGYSAYPECLIFALAMCAQQNKSKKLCHTAYEAVKIVCKTTNDLFLFVMFASQLSSSSKGTGSGWRRAIQDWYLSKEPLELAECVTRYRGRYSWTHRDLIKLTHIKTDNKAKSLILKYAIKGLSAVKDEIQKDPSLSADNDVQAVVQYLQTVEDFKHASDENTAARMLETHKLTLDHIPTHNSFISSLEIWLALVPQLPLPILLDNLVRLSCLGFLREGQPLEAHVVDRLTDQTAIVESQLHPTQVFITLRNYENNAVNKRELMQKLLKMGRIQKEIKPAAKPNTKVVAALNALLRSTLKLLVPTGMRYLVAINLGNLVSSTTCNGARNAQPAQVAILMTMCLLQAERDVTVLVYPKCQNETENQSNDMIRVKIDPEKSVEQNLASLRDTVEQVPYSSIGSPISWAEKEKITFDVCLVFTDYIYKKYNTVINPSEVLENYRKAMNLPQAKLITVALLSLCSRTANGAQGMLDIGGMDGKVARIIEAFSRGAF